MNTLVIESLEELQVKEALACKLSESELNICLKEKGWNYNSVEEAKANHSAEHIEIIVRRMEESIEQEVIQEIDQKEITQYAFKLEIFSHLLYVIPCVILFLLV